MYKTQLNRLVVEISQAEMTRMSWNEIFDGKGAELRWNGMAINSSSEIEESERRWRLARCVPCVSYLKHCLDFTLSQSVFRTFFVLPNLGR